MLRSLVGSEMCIRDSLRKRRLQLTNVRFPQEKSSNISVYRKRWMQQPIRYFGPEQGASPRTDLDDADIAHSVRFPKHTHSTRRTSPSPQRSGSHSNVVSPLPLVQEAECKASIILSGWNFLWLMMHILQHRVLVVHHVRSSSKVEEPCTATSRSSQWIS